jgi:hypothetical protein
MKILIGVALLSVSALGFAQNQIDVEKCTMIESDSVRLACYDNFFKVKSNVKQAQVEAKRTEPQVKDAPAVVAPPKLINEQHAASAVAATSTPINAMPPADAAIEAPTKAESTKDAMIADFGAEDLERNDEDADETLTRIESVIEDVSENRREIRTFTLTNGQMWRETETSRLRLREGMEIYIEKGLMSAHYLGKPSSNRRVRVKRVK